MRYRYLIMGILIAVPVGMLIHIWPQMPAYRIPGGRHFLADDPEQRQLLFLLDQRREQKPPVIQRYDATSGRLVSEMALQGEKWHPWHADVDSSLITKDLKTLAVFEFDMNHDSLNPAWTVFLYETQTGKLIGKLSFDEFHSKGFSPDGKWFAALHGYGKLAIVDTQNCQRRFEASKPESVVAFPDITVVSPHERKQLLFQCHVPGEDGQKIHALNLQNGETRVVGQLPADHRLLGGHVLNVRSFKPLMIRQFQTPLASWLRHEFDGERLSEGVPDSSFGSDYSICHQPHLAFESASLVSQHESYPDRKSSNWIALYRKLDSLGVGQFLELPEHDLGGSVRLIDRVSGKIQFEKQVAFPTNCRFTMGGSLMMLDPSHGVISLGAFIEPSAPPAIEIYRTDGWPRWIWTTLSVLAVLFVFALLARWRHLVIRRVASLRVTDRGGTA